MVGVRGVSVVGLCWGCSRGVRVAFGCSWVVLGV